MRIIITGATGLVGSALVRQAIANERITHIFVLTRKPPPEDVVQNKKVEVVLHEDFSSYPTELLSKLSGAEGCIWAIGGRVPQFPDVATFKKVNIDFTLAAADAFIKSLASQLPDGRKFGFVLCSGKGAERDQSKTLLFLSDTRKGKGQVESGLAELAKSHADRFDFWVVRPSGVLPPSANFASKMGGKLYSSIMSDDLAAAMIKILLDGWKEQIIGSDTLAQF